MLVTMLLMKMVVMRVVRTMVNAFRLVVVRFLAVLMFMIHDS